MADSNTPAPHPLGDADAFLSVFNFVLMLAVAVGLFMFLSGKVVADEVFEVGGLTIQWAVLIPPAVIVLYAFERFVSLNRPRTRFHALLDALDTLIVLVLVIGAALTWVPSFAAIAQQCGAPVVPYNVTTCVVIASFLIMGLRDFYMNHLMRMRYGRDGITGTRFIRQGPPEFRISFSPEALRQQAAAFADVLARQVLPDVIARAARAAVDEAQQKKATNSP